MDGSDLNKIRARLSSMNYSDLRKEAKRHSLKANQKVIFKKILYNIVIYYYCFTNVFLKCLLILCLYQNTRQGKRETYPLTLCKRGDVLVNYNYLEHQNTCGCCK